jgi:hypothetical protein
MDTRNMDTWNMVGYTEHGRNRRWSPLYSEHRILVLCTANVSHTHVTARAPTLHTPLPQMDPRAPANKTATNTPSEQDGDDRNSGRTRRRLTCRGAGWQRQQRPWPLLLAGTNTRHPTLMPEPNRPGSSCHRAPL